MNEQAHVVVQGVGAVYQGREGSLTALTGINLALRRGEFVSIIGPSGCGKSTLLRIVGGLQAPSTGQVLIDGRPPREAQHAKRIGFVFQDPSLLPWRNVGDNVALPLQVNRRHNAGADAATASSPQSLVELVGLSAFRRYYPHQLSGGMQQRVALARALVTQPELLLMDEPFGALDEMTREAMRFELLRVWRSQPLACSVLFVTHSIAEAVLLSDRVLVMSPAPGRIAADLRIDLPRPRPPDVETQRDYIASMRRLRELLRQPSAA